MLMTVLGTMAALYMVLKITSYDGGVANHLANEEAAVVHGYVHYPDFAWHVDPVKTLFWEDHRANFGASHPCQSCETKIYAIGASASDLAAFAEEQIGKVPKESGYSDPKICESKIVVAKEADVKGFEDACAIVDFDKSDPKRFTIRSNDTIGYRWGDNYGDNHNDWQYKVQFGWQNQVRSYYQIRDEYLGATRCKQPDSPCAGMGASMYSPYGSEAQNIFVSLQILVNNFLAEKEGKPTIDKHIFAPMPELNITAKSTSVMAVLLKVYYMWMCIVFVIIFFMASARLTEERELRIKDGLQIMGASTFVYNLHWIMTWAIVNFIYAGIISSLTWFLLFSHGWYLEHGLMVFLFMMGIVGQAFTVSVFFEKSTLAGLCASVVHILCTVCAYFPLDQPGTGFLVLLPQSLYVNYISWVLTMDMSDWEASSVFPYSRFQMVLLSFMTCIFWFMLWSYLELVIPRGSGNSLMPWFLCLPSWWSGNGGVMEISPAEAGSPAAAGASSAAGPTPTFEMVTITPGEGLVSAATPLAAAEPDPDPEVDITSIERRTSVAERISSEGRKSLFERIGQEQKAMLAQNQCVDIQNLCVFFNSPGGQVRAVDGASLTMYPNECFVLLGHNGAGKSTTMSVLTGLLRPSSGVVNVFGMRMPQDITAIRHIMGFCPQHDVLFNDLTVSSHIDLFMVITGRPAMSNAEIVKLVSDVGLGARADYRSSQLSGGMKRKLSVGISFAGNPRLVILDEPTSGMDPFSRRALWEFLKVQKDGRIVLLTTHFMDEADVLGDRVAIMRSGQVQTCGSPQFLKRKFGCGYVLTVVMQDKSPHVDAVKEMVRNIANGAGLIGHVGMSTVGKELLCNLPLEAEVQLPAILDGLHSKKGEFGIDTYGISVTNLEEVFLKVAAGDHGSASQRQAADAEYSRAMAEEEEVAETAAFVMPNPGGSVPQQIVALFVRRFHSARRDGKSFGTVCIVPIVMLFFACTLAYAIVKLANVAQAHKPTDIELKDLHTVTVAQEQMKANADAAHNRHSYPCTSVVTYGEAKYNPECPFSGSPPGTSVFDLPLEALGRWYAPTLYSWDDQSRKICSLPSEDDCKTRVREFVVAAGDEALKQTLDNDKATDVLVTTIDDGVKLVLVNNTRIAHALPLAIQSLFGESGSSLASAFLPRTGVEELKSKKSALGAQFAASMVVSCLANLAFCFVAIGVMGFVLMEKSKDVKHQLYISGCSYWAYWGSMMLWDCLWALCPIVMLYVFLHYFGFVAFIQYSAGSIMLLLLYVPAAVGFAYAVCLLVSSPMIGNTCVLFCNGLCGACCAFLFLGLSVGGTAMQMVVAMEYSWTPQEVFEKYHQLPSVTDIAVGGHCSQLGAAVKDNGLAPGDNMYYQVKRLEGLEMGCTWSGRMQTASTAVRGVSFLLPGSHLLNGLVHISMRHMVVHMLAPKGVEMGGEFLASHVRGYTGECDYEAKMDLARMGNPDTSQEEVCAEVAKAFPPGSSAHSGGACPLASAVFALPRLLRTAGTPLAGVVGMTSELLGMVMSKVGVTYDREEQAGWIKGAVCLGQMEEASGGPSESSMAQQEAFMSSFSVYMVSPIVSGGATWIQNTAKQIAEAESFVDTVDGALPDIRSTLSCSLGPTLGPWLPLKRFQRSPSADHGEEEEEEESLAIKSSKDKTWRGKNTTRSISDSRVADFFPEQDKVEARFLGEDAEEEQVTTATEPEGSWFQAKVGPISMTIPCTLGLEGGPGNILGKIGKVLQQILLIATIGEAVVGLVFLAFFFPILVVVLEGIQNSPRLSLMMTTKTPCPEHLLKLEDAAVKAEKARVAQVDPRKQIMYVRGLRKVFGDTHAVRGVTWAADQGMVFGLLGVNGAGKTTSFKMMSGIYTPADGEVRILGIDVLKETSQARRFIGYCPQFDAIIDRMTVNEHLYLYGRMKGLGGADLKTAVEAKVSEMQLSAYVDRGAGSLSGGNKRKLSVAMAIIGEPPVVFLDEPSTGMDPFARRFMWGVIQDVAEKRKQSVVVLTTHSMEEAEALCNKIAIQVDGQFRCFGSAQQLKSMYGQGYEVCVKFAQVEKDALEQIYGLWSVTADEMIDQAKASTILHDHPAALEAVLLEDGPLGAGRVGVTAAVLAEWTIIFTKLKDTEGSLQESFGLVALLEAHGHMAKWRIPEMKEAQLSDLLRKLQNKKMQLGLSDFSCSQATLEQIFNAFAQEQEARAAGGNDAASQASAPSPQMANTGRPVDPVRLSFGAQGQDAAALAAALGAAAPAAASAPTEDELGSTFGESFKRKASMFGPMTTASQVVRQERKVGPVDISALTRIAKDDRGLASQPFSPTFKGVLVQIFVRSAPFGGSDKSSNGHRYDSIPFANGMIAAGMSCQLAHYVHQEHDKFFELMKLFDFIIVRCNPGQIKADGGDQARFDEGMRQMRRAGIQVWPSADVMEFMGAKDALCKVANLNIGLEDTLAYYTPEEFSTGFKKTMKFQPRVIKQNRGSSGEGIWIVKLKSGAYCSSYGEASCEDSDVLELMEANDNHSEEHTVAEFIEFCVNGRTAKSGDWSSKGAGKYLEGGKAAGGQLVDQRFCPRIVEGELRYNLVCDTLVGIIHKKPKEGGISAVGGTGSVYTYYGPEEAKFASLTKNFLEVDLPKIMPALGLKDEPIPLWWTTDFILSSPEGTPTEQEKWIVGEFNCSCVGISKCLAAYCKDDSPNASVDNISQQDMQEAMRYGKLMGEKALAILTAAK